MDSVCAGIKDLTIIFFYENPNQTMQEIKAKFLVRNPNFPYIYSIVTAVYCYPNKHNDKNID